MKMIQAIIRPERFDTIKQALEQKGVVAMTTCEVRGRGEQKGITLEYRGKPVQIDFLPKIQIELVVKDAEVDTVIRRALERLQELEKQFQKLIEAQREILVKNEFDRVYTTAGASVALPFGSTPVAALNISMAT